MMHTPLSFFQFKLSWPTATVSALLARRCWIAHCNRTTLVYFFLKKSLLSTSNSFGFPFSNCCAGTTCARLEQAKAGVQKYPFGSSFDFFPLLRFVSYPAAILDFVDIRYCLVYPFSPSLQFSLFPFLDSSLQDTQAGYPKDLYLKNAWYPPEFLRWSSFGLLSPIILNLYFRVTNAHLAPCHSFRPSSKFTKAS